MDHRGYTYDNELYEFNRNKMYITGYIDPDSTYWGILPLENRIRAGHNDTIADVARTHIHEALHLHLLLVQGDITVGKYNPCLDDNLIYNLTNSIYKYIGGVI